MLGWVQQSSGVDPDAEAGDGSRGQKGADQNEPSDQKDDAAREAELAKIEGQNVHALLSTYSGKEIQEAIWDMAKFEDADSVFCRFLRARKWDLLRSLGMFAGALKWRLDFDVEVGQVASCFRVSLPLPLPLASTDLVHSSLSTCSLSFVRETRVISIFLIGRTRKRPEKFSRTVQHKRSSS